MGSVTLGELATFISSKNAGPFLLTIDIVFTSRDSYEHVRDSEVLTPQTVADLYKRDVSDIVGIYYFEPANAVKVTMRRPRSSGSLGDSDVYGAQQHVPLMELPIIKSRGESKELGKEQR
jgi:hypothetical protein